MPETATGRLRFREISHVSVPSMLRSYRQSGSDRLAVGPFLNASVAIEYMASASRPTCIVCIHVKLIDDMKLAKHKCVIFSVEQDYLSVPKAQLFGVPTTGYYGGHPVIDSRPRYVSGDITPLFEHQPFQS
jgi:hypothetical protein